MATAITKKPDRNVVNLSAPNPVSGKGTTYKVTWGLAASSRDSNNPARAEIVDVWWDIVLRSFKDRTKTKTVRAKQMYENLSASMSATLNVAAFASSVPAGTWTSGSFHPLGDWVIERVVVYAHTRNSKGEQPWTPSSRTLEKPRRPTVGELVQGEDDGIVSFTVTRAKGDAPAHSRDVHATVAAYDSRVGSGKKPVETKTQVFSENGTMTYDVADRSALGYDDWVRVEGSAYDRGVSGDSAVVSRSLYVSWPAKPTIGKVRTDSGKVTVPLSTNATTQHPTTGLRLEALVSVDYERSSDIPGTESWDEIGVEDNGRCTALSAAASEVLPDAGKVTWVRVKAWNQHESVFYRYSEPVRLTMLERDAPSAKDDPVVIVSAEPGADGTSINVALAWGPDGADDADSTELAWAKDPQAWRSNKGPESFDFEWTDGPTVVSGTAYSGSALVHVAELEEGTRYHFRARRNMGTDSGIDHGPWWPDGTVACSTAETPASVVLRAPASVPRGTPIALSWTFDSSSPQTAWEVVDGEGRVAAQGGDAVGSCVLDALRVESLVGGADSVTLSVRVSTGGDAVESDAATIAIADPPTLTVGADTVTSQPLSISLSCSLPAAVAISVLAAGSGGDSPTGIGEQMAGDTVWAWAGVPEWSGEEGGWTAIVDAPAGLDLRDGSSYSIEATASDSTTGLSSGVSSASFEVSWARVAPEPEGIVVTPSDSTGDDGARTLSASILLPASSSLVEGDSYDVWRVTSDGASLLVSGVDPGSTVLDRWAPFGGSPSYRVVVRTVDGSTAWRDYGYELKADALRIDFDNGYVELPYNLAIGDGWGKDFEARQKLDGSVDGYWNEGSKRTSDLTTDLVRVVDAASERSLRELARHAGPCMVRTPDGACFEADVEVGGLTARFDDGASSVSLSATEVEPTGAYPALVGGWGASGQDAEPEEEVDVP